VLALGWAVRRRFAGNKLRGGTDINR